MPTNTSVATPFRAPRYKRCGEFVIKEKLQLVRIGGRPLDLSPTERELLLWLLYSQGSVSKEEIAVRVWPELPEDSAMQALYHTLPMLARRVSEVEPDLAIKKSRASPYKISYQSSDLDVMHQEDWVTIGPFTVHWETVGILYDGKEYPYQTHVREIQLLCVLAQHMPGVVGHKEILEKVFPHVLAEGTTSLRACVSYTRTHLKGWASNVRIIARFRQGYCLVRDGTA